MNLADRPMIVADLLADQSAVSNSECIVRNLPLFADVFPRKVVRKQELALFRQRSGDFFFLRTQQRRKRQHNENEW